MDIIKRKLTNGIWRSDIYYKMANKGSLDKNHFGMRILQNLVPKSGKILDFGCGDGTRLNLLTRKKGGTGLDISEKAIKIAKNNYPNLKFIQSDLEDVPLDDNSFDLVYSAFVLEHLNNPERVIEEALRLLTENGSLVLIAPNYGAPNRCSPPFKGSRIRKLIFGLARDFIGLFGLNSNLDWKKVNPIVTDTNYHIDCDTTIEPYLGSLFFYMKNLKLKIQIYSSCWTEEIENAKIHQKFFRFLGERGIYPFNFWGPHLVLLVQKGAYGR